MSQQRGSPYSFLDPGQNLEITVWRMDNDEEGITFLTHIKELTENAMVITLPSSQLGVKLAPILQPGTVIGAVSYGSKSPIIFYPVVMGEVTKKMSEYRLQLPDTFEPLAQQRRYVRVPMRIPIKVERSAPSGGTVVIPANTLDLSGGGIKFDSARLFAIDEEIRIILSLTPDENPIVANAKVVMSQHSDFVVTSFSTEGSNRGLYVTAASFINLTQQQENAIVAECFRREIKSMKKSR